MTTKTAAPETKPIKANQDMFLKYQTPLYAQSVQMYSVIFFCSSNICCRTSPLVVRQEQTAS